MSRFDGRFIEILFVFKRFELIDDEREMRVELLVRCVVDERPRERDAVFKSLFISFELFALLIQSIEFLFRLVFEPLEQNLSMLFDLSFGLSFELIEEGGDLISLGLGRGLNVDFCHFNEME